MPYHTLTLTNGPLEENCYFLHEEGRPQGLLIDPGSEPQALEAALRGRGLSPALIVATHGHFDHIGAVHALAGAFKAPFGMSPADAVFFESLEETCLFYGMGATKAPAVDQALGGGMTLDLAGLQLKVLATPGHTPGGLCFYHPASGSLFSGDTLFAGSVGRSDMEGGSHEQLVAAIRAQLLSLPDGTRVYPGHGPATSIGAERRDNRFLQ